MRRLLRRVAPLTVRYLPLAACIALIAIDLHAYLSDPAVPGGRGRSWWGWWDQSHYLLSARSLAHGDFDPAHHWYPPGYAAFAAPFVTLSPLHGFLLPDLCCLVVTYLAFLVVARSVDVGAGWAALLFLLATCGSASIRAVWAAPWNTTLSSALIWCLLALTAVQLTAPPHAPAPVRPVDHHPARLPRFTTMGILASLIPFIRPTDALLIGIWAVGTGAALVRRRALRRSDLLAVLAGASIMTMPEAWLWLRIYGPHPSPYMRSSQALGFSFGSVGWRSYLLLLSPLPWFPYGDGIMQRLAWILPGLAGILALPWITRGSARIILGLMAAMVVCYSLMFFAYVDLIASGLWRYENIHYLKWTLPALVLIGFVLLRVLMTGPRRPALIAVATMLLLFGLRLPAHRVGDGEPAWLIEVPGPSLKWDTLYFGPLVVRDDRGVMTSIRDFRAMPDNHGWRLIALSRPFSGSPVLSGVPGRPPGPLGAALGATRWSRSLSIKLPCWIMACSPGP